MAPAFGSKNGGTTPGPTYMTNKQMGDYLHDLRANRITRPAGSRPLPQSAKSKRQSLTLRAAGPASPSCQSISTDEYDQDHPTVTPSRSSSRLSIRQSLDATISGRVHAQELDRLAREESDRRQKEKLEARAVRLALEEADQEEEEQRVFLAAQKEAEELIWRHQNPGAPYKPPVETSEDTLDLRGQDLNAVPTDNVINSEANTDASLSDTRYDHFGSCPGTLQEPSNNDDTLKLNKQRSTSRLAHFSITSLANRRKSSGTKRNPSGGRRAGFPNSEEQIYEDPVERPAIEQPPTKMLKNDAPTSARRNPFARAHAARQGMSNFSVKPFDRVEIQRNEPSQSRNAAYTSNPVQQESQSNNDEQSDTRYKDGVELRSDDIRSATSMRRKDRSPNLPSPTAVSDTPGRPIVSFKPDWTPPTDSTQVEVSERVGGPYASPSKPVPRALAPEPSKSASAPVVPTIAHPQMSLEDNVATKLSFNETRPVPKGHPTQPAPPIPAISLPEPEETMQNREPRLNSRIVPTIATPGVPAIAVDGPPSEKQNGLPASKMEPQKRETQPPIPVINEPRPSPKKSATAPASFMPLSRQPLRGASALCAQCALPISGKIVSAAGTRFHPQCFTCHHCGEGLECVAFYPEPAEQREKRLQRYESKMHGEDVEETEDSNPDDEGDDSLRFYCHLDFHELFSPRCKSCKTPIEGEVIVACGAEWHVGHFFCAQCGDPFDPSTPFVEKEGYAWCVNCHTNRYSAKCRKCRRPVTGVVVNALGAEWHDDCFCCTECNSKFEDGRFYLRGDNQAPVCPACEERRLKG